MNLLVNSIVIFLFIVFVVSMNMPQTNKSNFILNKLLLFIGITLLQIIVLLSDRVSKKCKPQVKHIVSEAVKIGLLAVVGYSLYIDVLFTDSLRDKYMDYISSPRKNMFFLAGLITVFIFGFKILDNLVLPMDCSS